MVTAGNPNSHRCSGTLDALWPRSRAKVFFGKREPGHNLPIPSPLVGKISRMDPARLASLDLAVLDK